MLPTQVRPPELQFDLRALPNLPSVTGAPRPRGAGHRLLEVGVVRHKRTVWYVVVAVVAGTFALAPAAVPASGNGDTRQIPASGVTSFNPTPSGVDNGLQQPELGPVQADSASATAASGGGGNGVNRSRSI